MAPAARCVQQLTRDGIDAVAYAGGSGLCRFNAGYEVFIFFLSGPGTLQNCVEFVLYGVTVEGIVHREFSGFVAFLVSVPNLVSWDLMALRSEVNSLYTSLHSFRIVL